MALGPSPATRRANVPPTNYTAAAPPAASTDAALRATQTKGVAVMPPLISRTVVALSTLLVSGALMIGDARAQTYLLQWGTFGSGNGQFSSPNGLAVDGS